jgi:vacuolar-type H+-ATPase subunit C/Vma6
VPDSAQEAPETPETKTAISIFKTSDGQEYEIEIKLPTPDQLAIYQVLQKKFRRASNVAKNSPDGNVDAQMMAKMMGNIFELITSMVANEDDADFIQSEVLAGRATLVDTLPLINDGVEALKKANEIKDEAPKTRIVTG